MPYFTDAPPVKNAQQSMEKEEPFSQQYSQHIFNIITQNGNGTGFRAADGRIVTNMRLIEGGGQIYAEQGRKRYQLGKNVILDDINELAVLDFVDTKPPEASGLKLASKPQEATVPVCIAGYPPQGVLNYISGESIRQIAQEDYRGFFGSQQLAGPLSIARLQDALEFEKRSLLEIRPHRSATGMVGSPVISNGEVLGIRTDLTNWSCAFAIPAEKISTILEQTPENSKFSMPGKYESGLQKYLSDWSRAPGTAIGDSILPAGSFAGLVASANLPVLAETHFHHTFSGLPRGFGRVALLGGSTALIGYKDLDGFIKSTNDLDTRYFGSSLLADAVALSGAALYLGSLARPALRSLALGVSTAGLTSRLGCELISNKYVLQPPVRSNGDPRRPFNLAR